jgi:CheY-like chemotaxis protein
MCANPFLSGEQEKAIPHPENPQFASSISRFSPLTHPREPLYRGSRVAYVLIVDDEVHGREALQRYLSKCGHEIASANNGSDALKTILARPPDLVLLDLFMPEMDGVGLLEVLRSYLRLRTLPVVILTAYPDARLLQRALRFNVTGVLTKSATSLPEIATTIDQALHRAPTPPDVTPPARRMDA